MTTLRDNPPFTGIAFGDRLRVTTFPSDSPYYYQVGSLFSNWAWSYEDWWIVAPGEAYAAPFNPDGLVGVRHLGALPAPGPAGSISLR